MLSGVHKSITLIVDFYFHSEVYEMVSVMASGLPEGVIMKKKSVIILLSKG